MKINKHATLNFIYNGRQQKIICMFSHMYKDKIPIYASKDIQNTTTLTLSDNSILTIISEETLNYDKDNIELYIIRNILKLYYNNDIPVDICCSLWFGFTKTIEIINKDNNINEEQKIKRINTLEKVMINKKDTDIKIPKMESIIDYFKYIDVA